MRLETRFSSHWVVAVPGSGKTHLLKYMLGRDLQRDYSIIVMDSKGELTDAVRNLALGDRLIVLDPNEPFAINPFDVHRSDQTVAHLTYMLAGLLETDITAKQNIFFETLVQALLQFPNPTLHLLWEFISKGPKAFKNQISELPEDTQSFFNTEWKTYEETSKEMQWRLRGLFGKPIIKAMLSAPKTRFHIGKAMDEGKVIIIDNAESKCTTWGCGFIGRLFISLIWTAGVARQGRPDHQKRPTFVYVDEAHLVIKKDQKIAAIIDSLRSQKVGLILAHQKLRGQIDSLHVQSSLENCAIKMANVEAGEIDYFSKMLDVPVDRMKDLPRGHFATRIRGEGSCIYTVPNEGIPIRQMTAAEQAAHKQLMKDRYGIKHEPLAADPKEAAAMKQGINEFSLRDVDLPLPASPPVDEREELG